MSNKLIVDDTDTSISYSGDWKILGPLYKYSNEYNGTVHRGDTNGQSLSYTFTGTSIMVYGTLDMPATKGLAGVTFQIDSLSPQMINATGTLTNNINKTVSHTAIYKSPNLVDGTHTLNINVTEASMDGPYFFFDFFTIETGQDSMAGHIIVDNLGGGVQYIPTFVRDGTPNDYSGTNNRSPANGSSATFSFIGGYLVHPFFPANLVPFLRLHLHLPSRLS